MKRFIVIGFTAIFTVLFSFSIVYANGGCPIQDKSQKFEGEGPFTIDAPSGYVISRVNIKAGTECTDYILDNNNCYKVSGINTNKVSVSKTGEGRNCKDISHITWEISIPDNSNNNDENDDDGGLGDNDEENNNEEDPGEVDQPKEKPDPQIAGATDSKVNNQLPRAGINHLNLIALVMIFVEALMFLAIKKKFF